MIGHEEQGMAMYGSYSLIAPEILKYEPAFSVKISKNFTNFSTLYQQIDKNTL